MRLVALAWNPGEGIQTVLVRDSWEDLRPVEPSLRGGKPYHWHLCVCICGAAFVAALHYPDMPPKDPRELGSPVLFTCQDCGCDVPGILCRGEVEARELLEEAQRLISASVQVGGGEAECQG